MNFRICNEEDSEEDETHMYFKCKVLTDGIEIDETIKVEHIFGSLAQQIKVMKYIMLVTRKRNIILQIRSN